MPATQRPDETREMRLITKVMEMSDDVADTSLAEFIARRRQPDSEDWRTWDQITLELHGVIGEIVTDVSLRRWASRYGIPDSTLPQYSPITPKDYKRLVGKSGIAI